MRATGPLRKSSGARPFARGSRERACKLPAPNRGGCARASLHGSALLRLFTALLILLCAQTVSAATLAEYRERVRQAAATFEEMASVCERLKKNESEEVWSRGGADPSLPLMLPKLQERARELLPASEKVEWRGGSMTADNGWLRTLLDEFERTSDNGARAESARSAAERLRALEVRLLELESGAAGERDKDADKGRLNVILRRPEFNREETAKGGALQRLIEQIVEWIRDLFPDIAPVRPGTNARVSQGAQILVLSLCAVVLGFALWQLWRRRLRGGRVARPREARVVLGERLEADMTPADLLEEAEKLARSGDLRGAIRKAYVALLCELGDRRIIRLAQHKTNRDYLQAVRKSANERLYTEMLPLTFNFELHWYGLQEASDSDWQDFRNRCRQVLKAV